MKRFGIDISVWQKDMDLNRAKNEGVEFAIIRGAYGNKKDTAFENNYKKCKNVGLPCGVYWWTRAVNEAQAKEDIGGQPMNFKLSDNQKYNMIWTLLNSRFNEENDYTMDYAICDVYDDYAVVYNFESQGYERVYYTKDDETDSLEITSRETAYIIDVNAEEKRLCC